MAMITNEDLTGRLLSPKCKIPFQNLDIVPLSLEEIFNGENLGYDKYMELLTILQVDKSILKDVPEEETVHIKVFDIILFDEKLLSHFVEFLEVFLRTDKIHFSKYLQKISVETTNGHGDYIIFEITNDNYDDFVDLMKKIYCVKFEKQENVKPANAKALEMLERIKKNEEEQPRPKRQAKFDLLSITSGVASRHPSLNYFNIYNLNVFQLWDAYHYLCINSQYDCIMNGIYTGNVSQKDIDFEEISWIKKCKQF
jgi:hypothetical protein